MSVVWGYGALNGPSTWPELFPAASGNKQSPINIVSEDAEFDANLRHTPLQAKYMPEYELCISNTGSSVKIECQEHSVLTGGPLGKSVYKLLQFHLHWGKVDERGAEHTVDGKMYSAELHLVHWNSTIYKSFDEAVDKEDGLAVICRFIESTGTCIDDLTSYWTYRGSLTTPPCFESAQFILFPKPMQFSATQMAALRGLKLAGSDSDCMVDNFRPVCDLGSRKVFKSF